MGLREDEVESSDMVGRRVWVVVGGGEKARGEETFGSSRLAGKGALEWLGWEEQVGVS